MTIGRVSLKQVLALLDAQGDRVSQSALSRYVAKYADALSPERVGGQILVDYETLVAHRSVNLRGAPIGSRPGVQTEAAPDDRAAPKPTRSEAQRPSSDERFRGRAEEAALNIRAQRMMRELELAERTGELTPKREVQDAAFSAVASLKSAFAGALNDAATTIARVAGVEAIVVRPHLRAFEAKGLEAFARALSEGGLLDEGGSAAAS